MDYFLKYFWLFAELGDLVKQKLPHEYESFRFYNMDLAFKLRYLELICLRYEHDKDKWEQTAKRTVKFMEHSRAGTITRKELEEDSRVLGTQAIQYSELLNLDIDSFFVFARILLDRIPYLLRPLYKGIVTRLEAPTTDFRKHLDWFKKNPEAVLDSRFYERMMSFRQWFEKEIREPRNELIVHPGWKYVERLIGFNGKVERLRYELRRMGEKGEWRMIESLELPDILRLLKQIIEFLEFLDGYFTYRLRLYLC